MIIECYSSFTCKTTRLICNYSFLKIKTLHTCLHVYIHIYSQILTRKQGGNLSGNWGGGGCLFIYSRVMPDGFLLKSTQIQKKTVGQNMNI